MEPVRFPDELNERIRAFQESRVILTALELDVFTAIGAGAMASEVAAKLHTDLRATETLLHALTAIGLLAKQNAVFCNTPVASLFLSGTSPQSARMSLLHMSSLWRSWSTLTECVRAGTAVGYGEMAERDDTWTEPFIAAMHRNALDRAPQVAAAVGAEGIKRMLDVGGGSGAYSIAFAQTNPNLKADILDLATVKPIAERHIREAGMSDQVRLRTGDLRSDDLGQGYDLVFISAVCHMLSPEENRDLLRRSYAALTPGGRVAIQDFILDPDKTAPKFAALFSLNMLVNTPGGASYSEAEYSAWLESAGFEDIRRIRLPGPADLIIGTK